MKHPQKMLPELNKKSLENFICFFSMLKLNPKSFESQVFPSNIFFIIINLRIHSKTTDENK